MAMIKPMPRIIHRSKHEGCVREIVDVGDVRSLHFGSKAKQSSMSLQNPHTLLLSYTRAMMCCLLFVPEPHSALLIGLGGGSLAKFLHRHFEDCHLDCVELDETVVDLAHEYFYLPQDPRIAIHIADGADFLHYAPTRFHGYDLILVDAYHEDGIAPSITQSQFIADCRQRLAVGGILVLNLWRRSVEFPGLLGLLRHHFGYIDLIPMMDKGNTIALAMDFAPGIKPELLRQRAQTLKQRFAIEAPQFLRQRQTVHISPSGK